jgi:hypothetical protein
MYNIQKDIENEIIDAINPIIDEYLQGRTSGTHHALNVLTRDQYDKYFDGKKKTIYDAQKDFRSNKSISQLIKDIKNVGYRNFCKINNGENELSVKMYRSLVIKLLNDIIRDRIALEKDNNNIMENKLSIKTFEIFFESKSEILNEMVLPVMKIDEILDDVTIVTNDTLKRVLTSFYKTYDDYIDLSDKKKHFFKVHDMVGDIMNNNRVSFDACIFEKGDIQRIKENLVVFAIGEFHNALPSNLNVFGMDLKPNSFLNKEELKNVFEEAFLPEEVIKIITNILGYKYEGQFNDFFIWSNKQ